MNLKNTFIYLGLLIGLSTSCTHTSENNNQEVLEASLALAEVDSSTYLFEILVDSLTVEEHEVKKNESLADILTTYDVEYVKILELAQNADTVFNVRKIRQGKEYTLLFEQDSAQTLDYFIYQINPVDYVVFDLKDSCKVYRGAKPVEVRKKMIESTITSSFYQAVVDQGESPVLVNAISEVFSWQIDFFHIQKDDAFKVIYYEKVVDDHVVGIDHIEAAIFNHFGKDYYAFAYEHDGRKEFFDEEGNSLRKEFLKAPLNYSRISSNFSRRRFHPVQKRYKAHLGTDYAAPRGTPIHSVGDGVVVEARYSKYNGNYVKIRHNSVYTTQYLHMSKIAKGIKKGVNVVQGQEIGYVGSTGLATGPHLCYRFWKNGVQVDARKQEIPSSDPLPDSLIAPYQETIKEVKNTLDQASYVM